MTEDKAAIFLVSGMPCSKEDLDCWTAFQTFIADIEESRGINVCVETFLYGDGEAVDATPEEVAYIYKRVSMRPDFIEARTHKVSDSEFFIKHR